ncbi:MAG: protein kinase [Blastocatellia bacterium]|nr:protein kinase [Blastocatellia bacterium]
MDNETNELSKTGVDVANQQTQALLVPLPSTFADGRYELRRLIGQGGQKQVFLAWDTRLSRDVAISLLKIERLDSNSITRLWREARMMGRLGDHPHIVTLHDVGEEAGRPYIVSQYIEGGSVGDLLKRSEKHRLPIEEATQIAEQVCQALAYAHSLGVVHRDLKPGNVWLTQEGKAMLGDFGLAIGLDLSRITMEGVIIGTALYLSPEQILGHEAGPRSDLYSLGVMLYEMVTGRTPFVGDQLVTIISQHISAAPVAPSFQNPEIPESLEKLILQLLAKAPDDRPESAAAVAQMLTAISTYTSESSGRPAQQDFRSLARLAGGVFVGREQEISALQEGLNDAIAGQARLFMLIGDPGSGKTRTTEQLAIYARLRKAEVLVGRCYEGEGAPAFWPWVQIIRTYAQERSPESLFSVMSLCASEIARVVPEVGSKLPDLPPPPALEPAQARFRLFDSITAFLKNAARARPLVLILEDLHWADTPSLLLLQFLAREIRDSRLLVIGTFRDIELRRHHPLARTLAELSRQNIGKRIILRGLTEPDVARFIEVTAGIEPAEEIVMAVYKETEGNPFFVKEIVRLMVSEGHLERLVDPASLNIRIPESVREVVGRRLDRLSEEAYRILTIASVLGREFGLDDLGPLHDFSSERLIEHLEEAEAARVINEIPKAPGRYRFSHLLICETLYDGISTARRAHLHQRIAQTLESLHADSLDLHLAEIAFHYFQAAPGGDADKAISYAVRAAERATRLLAYEEAAGHYERALKVLELSRGSDENRCELLLAQGEAHMKVGNTEKARECLQQAASLARRMCAPEQLARAALGMGTGAIGGTRYGQVDQLQVDLLEEALDALGEGDSALRCRLLGQLALALYYWPGARRVLLSQQAVEMARRAHDDSALLSALFSRCITLEGYNETEERLEAATELVRIAEETGNEEMALRGHYRRFRELIELGNISAAIEEREIYVRLAEELRQPLYLWLVPFSKASLALLEGRFEECEQLAKEALAIVERVQDENALLFFRTIMAILRRTQGRAEELEAGVKEFLEKYPSIPAWRASLANIYREMKRPEEARVLFEGLASNNFADLPRDGAWLGGMALLSSVCAFLKDSARAAIMYEILCPFADRNIVVGSSAICYGPVTLYLGMLAETLGRNESAAGYFEEAIKSTREIGARPFEAYARYEYAAMLIAGKHPGDPEKATENLEQAFEIANQTGMKGLIEDIQSIRQAT